MSKRPILALTIGVASLGLVIILLWGRLDGDSGEVASTPGAGARAAVEQTIDTGLGHQDAVKSARPPRFHDVGSPAWEVEPPGYAGRQTPSATDFEQIQNLRNENIALTESLRSAGMSDDEISAMQQASEDHIAQLMQPEAIRGPTPFMDSVMLRSNLSEALDGAGFTPEAIEAMTAAMIPDDTPLPPPPEAERR